jgi:hypothetical protein
MPHDGDNDVRPRWEMGRLTYAWRVRRVGRARRREERISRAKDRERIEARGPERANQSE